jgi:hypothetical protein
VDCGETWDLTEPSANEARKIFTRVFLRHAHRTALTKKVPLALTAIKDWKRRHTTRACLNNKAPANLNRIRNMGVLILVMSCKPSMITAWLRRRYYRSAIRGPLPSRSQCNGYNSRNKYVRGLGMISVKFDYWRKLGVIPSPSGWIPGFVL